MDTSHVLKYEPNMENTALAELLQLVKKGENGAFGRLYDLYFLKIYRFIFYRVGHKETAEDLTEEVFLKVFVKLGSLAKPGAFEGWLYQIARNLIIDYYRKVKITVAIEDVENTLEYESNTLDALSLQYDQKILIRALKQLSSDEQALLKMKFFEELENAVIAAVLNKSEGAIRVMQHRALNKLHQIMSRLNK